MARIWALQAVVLAWAWAAACASRLPDGVIRPLAAPPQFPDSYEASALEPSPIGARPSYAIRGSCGAAHSEPCAGETARNVIID